MSEPSGAAGTRWRVQINPPVFYTSSALTLVFVAFAAAFPDLASGLFETAQKEITHSAGWTSVGGWMSECTCPGARRAAATSRRSHRSNSASRPGTGLRATTTVGIVRSIATRRR